MRHVDLVVNALQNIKLHSKVTVLYYAVYTTFLFSVVQFHNAQNPVKINETYLILVAVF
jgi:hypothetical protein